MNNSNKNITIVLDPGMVQRITNGIRLIRVPWVLMVRMKKITLRKSLLNWAQNWNPSGSGLTFDMFE